MHQFTFVLKYPALRSTALRTGSRPLNFQLTLSGAKVHMSTAPYFYNCSFETFVPDLCSIDWSMCKLLMNKLLMKLLQNLCRCAFGVFCFSLCLNTVIENCYLISFVSVLLDAESINYRGKVVTPRCHGSKISGWRQTENVTQKVNLYCSKTSSI